MARLLSLFSSGAIYGKAAFTLLYTFAGGTDGAEPSGALVLDPVGNVYGVTFDGGDLTCPYRGEGCGVIFKVDTATLRETVIHAFTRSDGAIPQCLVADSKGNFYGTTMAGGAFNSGVVFKHSRAGAETIIHNFNESGNPAAGWESGGLVRDTAGNLYGATDGGGDLSCGLSNEGCGLVFKVDPTGAYSVFHSFEKYDGYSPQSSLLLDAAGNLYGTTYYGGRIGRGVVFKLSPTGDMTVLHSFSGPDGEHPESGLIEDSEGNLYGVTPYGGASSAGVVYKIDEAGDFTVLYSFTGAADGGAPIGNLALNPATGKLYGVAGLIFELDPASGVETVLYSFQPQDGWGSDSGLIGRMATDGSGVFELFGTNGFVGNSDYGGTVFELAVGP